jgi:hypothetical protein
MRPVFKVFMIGAAVALLVPALPAQPPGFGPGGGVLGLFSNKDVQKELKLSDEQVAKGNKAMQEAARKHQADLARVLASPFPVAAGDEQLKKYLELSRQLTDDAVSGLGDSLKPEQAKRLKQIALQQTIHTVGAGIFLDPDVDKALKLTDKQKEDLKGKIEELRKKQTSALKDAGTDPMELFKKQAALGSESVEGAVKLLTDDQKKAWKDLVGEPFEFKAEKAPEKKEPAK